MALTAAKEVRERAGDIYTPGVAANVTIHAGALTCLNAAGYAVPGSVATTLIALGRAEETAIGGSVDGISKVRVKRGCFLFKNKADDLVTRADVGKDCYVADDETVAKTSGTNTRSRAGIVHDVDDLGVWVRF